MNARKTLSALTSLAVVLAASFLGNSNTTEAPVVTPAPAAPVAPLMSAATTAATSMSTMMAAALGTTASTAAAATATGSGLFNVVQGSDVNGADNPFAQPQNPALAGGGRDQTQQFFDILIGSPDRPSIINGRLGGDLLLGGSAFDYVIGGLEHFNPNNRDKAFMGGGDDCFLWKPGDGSDIVDGGPGEDTVMFGLVAEDDGNGNPVFGVSNDQMAGNLFFDFFGFPAIDVSNSPGFCNVIDSSTSPTAAQELAALGVTHLAQFIIRSINQDFVNGVQNTDNGLRVTLQLRDIEYLVCTSPNGGATEAFDLRTTPPTPIPTSALPLPAQFILQ